MSVAVDNRGRRIFRLVLVSLLTAGLAGQVRVCGQDSARTPVETVWLMSRPMPSGNGTLEAIRPEVHEVKRSGAMVEIKSAGTSLHYFGPLQTPGDQAERRRRLRYRLPLAPRLNSGQPVPVRPDASGVLANGVPLYDQTARQSYLGQNIWHFDPLAINDDGSRVVGGRPRPELTHQTALGLLERLIADGSRHSPIIGFAFDGFPIYGPWGFDEPQGRGGVRRQQSGYQLRQMERRHILPDGTRLTPGQEGPEVGEQFPLGTFVEDYEFAGGSDTLDQFNGRWTVTPDYPQGTYAYFLTTDAPGRLAFPYLLASHYRGEVEDAQLVEAFRDEAAGRSETRIDDWRKVASLKRPEGFSLELSVQDGRLYAGDPVHLRFQVRAAAEDAAPIRFLEHVHERPLHLLIVTEDLAEFEHVHPLPAPWDRYSLEHRFEQAGRYRLYADYTPPGGTRQVVSYVIDIAPRSGRPRPAERLRRPGPRVVRTRDLELSLTTTPKLRAGEEVELRLKIRDRAGRQPEGLEPFLGAWAHFVIIDPDHRSFIHAHPVDEERGLAPETLQHSHRPLEPGPPPSEIRTLTIFPRPGLYRLWAQFQVDGEVVTQPFDIHVGKSEAVRMIGAQLPAGVIRVRVDGSGFSPAEISVPAGGLVRLAFDRRREANCANQVVFPALGWRRALPAGKQTLIEFTAPQSGTLHFSCGMGMYRGLIVTTSSKTSGRGDR